MATLELLTPEEAAKALTISIKTLREHVKAGEIAFVPIGRGTKRQRWVFTPEDIKEFIDRRRDRQCQSTNQIKAPTINMTSSSTVVAFTDLPRPQPKRRQRR